LLLRGAAQIDALQGDRAVRRDERAWHLVRAARNYRQLGECRPQRLVTCHHDTQREANSVYIQQARALEREELVVVRAIGSPAMKEPKALLPLREVPNAHFVATLQIAGP